MCAGSKAWRPVWPVILLGFMVTFVSSVRSISVSSQAISGAHFDPSKMCWQSKCLAETRDSNMRFYFH